MASVNECLVCHRPLQPGIFCQYCGTFVLDPNGTVVMASRLSRLGSWLVNLLLFVLTLGIGWIIWWFIVAPKGQNPGKAVVGLRVIRADGTAATTGWMFVRGLLGIVLSIVPFYLDNLWLLWDPAAQTLHDKLAATVVVRAQGSEHVVAGGSVGVARPGVQVPPPFAPPVTLPGMDAPPTQQTASGSGTSASNTAEELARLQDLRSRGLITEEEYQEKRKAVIDRL